MPAPITTTSHVRSPSSGDTAMVGAPSIQQDLLRSSPTLTAYDATSRPRYERYRIASDTTSARYIDRRMIGMADAKRCQKQRWIVSDPLGRECRGWLLDLLKIIHRSCGGHHVWRDDA